MIDFSINGAHSSSEAYNPERRILHGIETAISAFLGQDSMTRGDRQNQPGGTADAGDPSNGGSLDSDFGKLIHSLIRLLQDPSASHSSQADNGDNHSGTNASHPLSEDITQPPSSSPANPQGSEKLATDPQGSQKLATDPQGSEKLATDPQGSEKLATDPQGSEKLATDPTVNPDQETGTGTKKTVGNSSLGGTNNYIDNVTSNAQAAQLVDQTQAAGGGTLRMQIRDNQLNTTTMGELQSMVQEGDKDGVKVQIAYREDDAPGGGGVSMSGSDLTQAETDESKFIKNFKNDPSFELDTVNESGTQTNAAWFAEESALDKNALNQGLAGNKIINEDDEWGQGKSNNGTDSGLATYGKQLLAIDPELQASFHVYNPGSTSAVSSGITSEVDALRNAGFDQKGQIQIGEAGNDNGNGYLGGVEAGIKNDASLLQQDGIAVLPWMDQYSGGAGSPKTATYGYTPDQQWL